MRTVPVALSACVLAVTLLAGCGDDGDDATGPSGTPSPTPSTTISPSGSPSQTPPGDDGIVIDATIRGDDLEPNGERVKVDLGETVTINVDSDRDGELHVHSTPEQELEYSKGMTTLELSFDTPGIIEIEDHIADKVLVSLEVS